jgi:hypothetical protein
MALGIELQIRPFVRVSRNGERQEKERGQEGHATSRASALAFQGLLPKPKPYIAYVHRYSGYGYHGGYDHCD